MGKAIEANAVNLAVVSGVLEEALHLDSGAPQVSPATDTSAYTFTVRPHRDFPDLQWNHQKGQVEIDALVFGKRKGRPTLFLVEAKRGHDHILPKYKLVYPALAIAEQVKNDGLDLIPVSLCSWSDCAKLYFHIAEMACPNLVDGGAYVSDLTQTSGRLLWMENPFY
ncbi:MAG: hypothetical protein QF573_07145 [Chloroflexota bacterium]|jgi:hypothetical protein|nr:hypothetical protein [Chloroflexota bacterium]|tara:strand:+ start:597 stop:1097 length:501 start_codon:yes stop_codon:yes gene_type:complete